MTQNMFQEGLHQVYVSETLSDRAPPEAIDQGDLKDATIRRWFGTVVGSRVLVTGVQSYFCTVLLLYSPNFHESSIQKNGN